MVVWAYAGWGLVSVVLVWCGFSWFRGFCNLLFYVLCDGCFAGGLFLCGASDVDCFNVVS